MKKNFIFKSMLMFALICMPFAFSSCNDDEEDWDKILAELEQTIADMEFGGSELAQFRYNSVLMAPSVMEVRMLASLHLLLPNEAEIVGDDTRMLIVPELSSAYEKEITRVYNNGGVIAVVKPSRSNLDDWFSKHDWMIGNTGDEHINEAMLYSFSTNHSHIVYYPDNENLFLSLDEIKAMGDKDDPDFFYADCLKNDTTIMEDEGFENDGSGELDALKHYESENPDELSWAEYLSPWIDLVNEKVSENESRVMSRAEERVNVEDLFRYYHYGATYPWTVTNRKVRKLAGSSPDCISGTGSITYALDIYQVHRYDDESIPGDDSGDYYLVKMKSSLASGDMFKNFVNKHGGFYMRVCGFFAEEFIAEFAPGYVDSNGNFTVYGTDKVMIPASAGPIPRTTVGQTTYSESFEFGLGAGIGAEAGANTKGGAEGKISADFSVNASWSTSQERTINDVAIYNKTYGNIVYYSLEYFNLPEYKWVGIGFSPGFTADDNGAFRSTSSIESSWVWWVPGNKVPDAKDDSTGKPLAIKFSTRPVYGAKSWFSGTVDLKHYHYTDLAVIKPDIIHLNDFVRTRMGKISIKNRLADNQSISEISVYRLNGSKEENVWTYAYTLPYDETIESPALKVSDKYAVYITVAHRDENGNRVESKYKYSKNNGILTLETAKIAPLYAGVESDWDLVK